MDSTATLRKATVTTDQVGNEVRTYSEKEVFCKARSVTRSEFYDAAQAGLRPSIVLTLATRLDYEGEEEVTFEGRTYGVIRTYWTDASDEIELTLEERTALNG